MMKQLLIFMVLLQSCGDKFYMTNMLGDDEVDISKYIKNGYKPMYCEDKIYKLINRTPDFTPQSDLKYLEKEIKIWLKENGYVEEFIIKDTSQDIHYQYSYLMTYHPIDVYTAKVFVADTSLLLFFRKDNGVLISPINSSSWLSSKCDNKE